MSNDTITTTANPVKMSPPWITFLNEMKALFADDPEVKVVYDDNNITIKLYVDDLDKADALEKIMPAEKNFGNVLVKINVYPANHEEDTAADLFARAFDGNPVVKYTHHAETIMGNFNYVVCRRDIIQFFNDQLNDINGNKSMLIQDVMNDVFGDKASAFFCTDTGRNSNLSKPLGEWP